MDGVGEPGAAGLQSSHAAPTELADGSEWLPCYKYVAPTGASLSGCRALQDLCKELGKRLLLARRLALHQVSARV